MTPRESPDLVRIGASEEFRGSGSSLGDASRFGPALLPQLSVSVEVDVRGSANPEGSIFRSTADAPAGARLVIRVGDIALVFLRDTHHLHHLASIRLVGRNVGALTESCRSLDEAIRRDAGGGTR